MITANGLKVKEVSQVTTDNVNNVSWQSALANAIRDPLELLSLLDLDEEKYIENLYHTEKFKLLVPLSYISKMKKGDWNDPLLKQVLPVKDETQSVAGFLSDPVGDLDSVISTGVLQKYQGRVLLITTGACAVHCRYCFRRHFPYANSMPDKDKWQETLASILNDESVHEVILSGGDPFMIPDDRLQSMCADLVKIPHIKTLRFHTRIPIFLPERINTAFISWLAELPIQKVMVIHANHANELDKVVGEVLVNLRDVGVTLLNQSVLLKDINNNVETLAALSHRLFEFQVLPYYLHQLDKVEGAAHFEVNRDEAIHLLTDLKSVLPGYLVPKLVEEVSGERSKRA
ncbi:MAG: EF-P beta-lysylation protein EpmB, partial [Thiotrichaceae bacterium]|nr:EF-P beta-lysylation protein EpmB [Thiotrichaceae bacterium]